MSERKTVQIPLELFVDICNYFFWSGDESPIDLSDRITVALVEKVKAMKRHDEYHTNKHKNGGVPPT